jgi:putative acyl-CoA dehydrogenase
LAAEAMEVLGGNGYVEEYVLARIYRELPVNSIWEGSGNIMCLDVLRALGRMPGAAELLARELTDAAHADKRLASVVGRLDRGLKAGETDESQARAIVRDLILASQAALLLKHSPTAVAEAFCASRLGDEPGGTFGLLPPGTDLRFIADRAAPLHH